MIPACEFEPIIHASHNLKISELEALLKYMSSYHQNDKSQDRGEYLPLVCRLKEDIDKRKVKE